MRLFQLFQKVSSNSLPLMKISLCKLGPAESTEAVAIEAVRFGVVLHIAGERPFEGERWFAEG